MRRKSFFFFLEEGEEVEREENRAAAALRRRRHSHRFLSLHLPLASLALFCFLSVKIQTHVGFSISLASPREGSSRGAQHGEEREGRKGRWNALPLKSFFFKLL